MTVPIMEVGELGRVMRRAVVAGSLGVPLAMLPCGVVLLAVTLVVLRGPSRGVAAS